MQLELPKECAQMTQIGKSNNSHIYKQIGKSGEDLSHVVKIIIHSQPGQHQKECAHLHNEHAFLSRMQHSNIIGVKGTVQSCRMLKKVELCAMEVELADIDLFDKMSTMYPKVLSPGELRKYFRQVTSAVGYIHERQIVHNDIKLENIFLFKGHKQAKLADFGFARDMTAQRYPSAESQRLYWQNRCKTMLAPEILQCIRQKPGAATKLFDETKSDVFALGVTLFQSLFLRTPFAGDHASETDEMFKHFYTGKVSEFWALPDVQSILKFLQKQVDLRAELLIDLLNGMLAVDPAQRLSIEQVAAHPWLLESEEFHNSMQQ